MGAAVEASPSLKLVPGDRQTGRLPIATQTFHEPREQDCYSVDLRPSALRRPSLTARCRMAPRRSTARRQRAGFVAPHGAVRYTGDKAQTADRHSDVPQAARAELLLRRQDALHPTPARRGHPLFPVAPPPVRQEPVPGHAEGAVRGQRGAVRRAAHPRRPRLVTAPSGGAPQLRRRQLHRAGRAGSERHGATRRLRTAPRSGIRVPDGGRPLRVSAGSPAPADRSAGRGAGGRVRQADPGRAGAAGGGARQPRLPARPCMA